MSSAAEIKGYDPSSPDVVSRVAVYTVNLITILLRLNGDAIPLDKFAPDKTDPLEWWRSTVRLWHAGLEPEGWTGVFATMTAIDQQDAEGIPLIRALGPGEKTLSSDDQAQDKLLFKGWGTGANN